MFFWENIHLGGERVAFIDENSKFTTYFQLSQKVEYVVGKHFNFKRKLVVVEASKSLDTVIFYLACLKTGNPVLLVDFELDETLKQSLYYVYQPKMIVSCSAKDCSINSFAASRNLEEDLAVLLSTSGTTGTPKLVKLSHKNIQSNAESICDYLRMGSEDRAVSLLAFHYSYGLSILNSHLNCFGSILLTSYSVMNREFWKLFKEHSVNSIAGVPYIYQILEKLRFNRMNLPSLRYLTQAGGKLSPALVETFSKWSAEKEVNFYVMYGQTEATARITYLSPEIVSRKPSSIGQAIPGGQLNLVDGDGKFITKSGIEGELVYQGPNVMLGYAESLADLELSQPAIELFTGDIAKFDDDGDFYIVGRTKRFIKMYGLRINLDQVELLLSDNGYECACGGTDDQLIIVCKGEESKRLLANLIANKFKLNVNNVSVKLVEELARTSSGKLDYKKIFG